MDAPHAHPEIIIIKRHGGDHEEEHHGGAWKIAFADFMTAMMAFFLVLWIINATDKDTKTVIARYFNPVKLEDPSKARKGIREQTPASTEVNDPDGIDGVPPTPPSDGAKDGRSSGAKAKDSKETTKEVKDAKEVKDGKSTAPQVKGKDGDGASTEPIDPAQPKATFQSEGALFKDPYASLDKIAGPPPAPSIDAKPPSGATASGAGESEAATQELDAFSDPFKPSGRAGGDQLADVAVSGPSGAAPDANDLQSAATGRAPPSKGPPIPQDDRAAASGALPRPTSPGPATGSAAGVAAPSPPSAQPGLIAATTGQPTVAGQQTAANAAAQNLAQSAAQLLKDISRKIGASNAQPGPGVEVKETDEGLLISLTDAYDFSMFPVGSAEPQAKIVRIMETIAQSLKSRPGSIVVRGHTDGRAFKSGTYDNWRLSSARAQMAYYMLVRGGLPEKRFERVEGYADRKLKIPSDPTAAENRRIEILLRKDKS
jgi:chemotaxis protein MotB